MKLETMTIMITGATSGIGLETARLLATRGCPRLILLGRRADRLQTLAEELYRQHKTEVYTLPVDIRDHQALREAYQAIPEPFKQIDVLLNNAGLAAGLDTFDTAEICDWERMIDTNIKGLLYISKLVIPQMIDRQRGQLINVASIAGKEVYRCGNVYCATKHAVDALTRAMRLDLADKGIKVSQVAPGAVNTEFSNVRFHGDDERAAAVYKGYTPLIAKDIAECIAFIITAPEHVNIADMLILPTAQADGRTIYRTE